ncbi:MAG: DoxX family protein [Myxococcales bacterium]|jgi:putative oxidoreductase
MSSDNARHRDLGLLLLRVGMGAMFIAHGWPKLAGGPERWEKLGGALQAFGIDFAPTLFGLAAGLAEALGGLLLALGIFFRPALAALTFTMVVATAKHLDAGDGFIRSSHAIEAAIVFGSLILIGPGKYRLGRAG